VHTLFYHKIGFLHKSGGHHPFVAIQNTLDYSNHIEPDRRRDISQTIMSLNVNTTHQRRTNDNDRGSVTTEHTMGFNEYRLHINEILAKNRRSGTIAFCKVLEDHLR